MQLLLFALTNTTQINKIYREKIHHADKKIPDVSGLVGTTALNKTN